MGNNDFLLAGFPLVNAILSLLVSQLFIRPPTNTFDSPFLVNRICPTDKEDAFPITIMTDAILVSDCLRPIVVITGEEIEVGRQLFNDGTGNEANAQVT